MPAPASLPDLFQGEGKWIKFTYTRDGVVLDLSTATFAFSIKETVDDADTLFDAESGDFDTTQAALGIVRVNIPASVTSSMEPGSYIGQMKVVLTAETDIDKSQFVKFKILKAVVNGV